MKGHILQNWQAGTGQYLPVCKLDRGHQHQLSYGSNLTQRDGLLYSHLRQATILIAPTSMLSRRQHLDCDQPRIHRAHPQAFMAGMHEKVLSTPFSKQSLQINFREDNRQAACARTM